MRCRIEYVFCLILLVWFLGIATSWSKSAGKLAKCEKRTSKLVKKAARRAAAKAAKAAEPKVWGPPAGDLRYKNWSEWWPLQWPAVERRYRPACAPCNETEAAYLIPSFPTSGSEYVKTFYSEVTGVGQGEVYGPQPGFALLRLYGAYGDEFASFYYTTKYPPPLGQATLLKTH